MMNAITLKNLSDEAAQALAERAAESGRTVEAEAERMLQDALTPLVPKKEQGTAGDLVQALQDLGKRFPELADMDFSRDQTPARSPSFE